MGKFLRESAGFLLGSRGASIQDSLTDCSGIEAGEHDQTVGHLRRNPIEVDFASVFILIGKPRTTQQVAKRQVTLMIPCQKQETQIIITVVVISNRAVRTENRLDACGGSCFIENDIAEHRRGICNRQRLHP